jgi:alanyl-tRNA synthetase
LLPRDEAERRYGIRIFQGGVPEGLMIRVVAIKDTDVECCGGTHLFRTGQVGSIRIKRGERVADGVERLVYCGALSAVEEGQRVRHLLEDAALQFSVSSDDLPKTAQRFFDEWKERGKEVDRLRADLTQAKLAGPAAGLSIGGARVVVEVSDRPSEELLAQAKEVAKGAGAVGVFVSTAGGKGARLIVCRSADVPLDARAVLRAALEAAGGGGGGGKADFAQGGAAPGVDAELLREKAVEAVRAALAPPS